MLSKNNFEVFLGTYNAAPWISDILQMLEEQNTEPFTVRIVDNASEDNTVKIIEEFFKKYKFKNNYYLIQNEFNIGAISSFLDRLSIFESDWILMIHQDDIYHSDHISTLKHAIETVSDDIGIIFSAMQRADGEGRERISPPTLSSKITSNNKFENFLLSLQISPINFPATALRKSDLIKSQTTRHTTAFNDTELLLRMSTFTNIKYIQKETLHYRVFAGNAASVTKSFSNDRAVFIGLNEIFHSTEFSQILSFADSDEKLSLVIESVNRAIDIRITEKQMRILAKNVFAEVMIRKFGYLNTVIRENLVKTFEDFDLAVESKLANNQQYINHFKSTKLNNHSEISFLESRFNKTFLKSSRLEKILNKIPLRTRESLFNRILLSKLLMFSNRAFIKVWRSHNKDD